jgi:signal transduction histidine kinase
VFALVLIVFGTALGWLAYTAAKHHQHDVMQRLSRALAQRIVNQEPLITGDGIDRDAVDTLFRMTVAVNPSIEVYLLDSAGNILAHAPSDGTLALERVSLAPIHDFIARRPLPILGDSPRSASRQQVFSAAPIVRGERAVGYVYVVLLSDMYRQMADDARREYVLRSALWIGAAALGLALIGGLTAFAWITRPLNRLTRSVEAFEQGKLNGASSAIKEASAGTGEIGRLSRAFEHMAQRLVAQMTELKHQDDLRRELVANVSHDLRTPLTSMQSYLETLERMGEALSHRERQEYLQVAVRQSRRVAKLAQQLFELARLECEETLPHGEVFSLSELTQDIAQKFALAADEQRVRLLTAGVPHGLFVHGDIGMIERVITNLIDNAIRHTPAGGEVRLELTRNTNDIEVRVADTGVGIAAEYLPGLFRRDSPLRLTPSRTHGGLGLLIAHRILALHGADIAVASDPGRGTTFSFALPAVQPG